MKFERYRELLGHFVFELVIVFVGVTAAFALEGMRQRSEETAYRRSMISALVPTLDDVLSHNKDFADHVGHELAAFDSALARGAHPPIPIYRENDSERPPTRAWDAVVTTGVARSLDPGLFFRLARFYTREDSYGERYLRYNDFTEQFDSVHLNMVSLEPAAAHRSEDGILHSDPCLDLLWQLS